MDAQTAEFITFLAAAALAVPITYALAPLMDKIEEFLEELAQDDDNEE